MKVTHVNTLLGGGAARAVQRLHEGLGMVGCDSRVYTLSHDAAPFDQVSRFIAPRDVLSRLGSRLRKMRIERDFSSYTVTRPGGLELFSDDRSPYTAEVFRQMPDCDVVNLHWIAGFVDYGSFFFGLGKPVVWTMHDMNAFTGGCHYNMHCERFRYSCGACPQLGSSEQGDLSSAVLSRKAESFDRLKPGQMHIVATSQWMKREVESSALFHDFSVSVIPLALDAEVFRPCDGAGMRSALGISQKARVVLFAADSVSNQRKGFAEFYAALEGLQVDGEVFLLTIGGSAPDLNPSFGHFHVGQMNNDHIMAAIYSAADIFVIPSLQEAFGQTALEAMACGTPVVGFDAGGIPDMVRPGVTGLLAPPGDVAGLRLCMAQVLNDAEQRRGMAGQCRRIVEDEYALTVQAGKYAALYEAMLAP